LGRQVTTAQLYATCLKAVGVDDDSLKSSAFGTSLVDQLKA
jgi:hypothetical protein